jgi:hypothetical protein
VADRLTRAAAAAKLEAMKPALLFAFLVPAVAAAACGGSGGSAPAAATSPRPAATATPAGVVKGSEHRRDSDGDGIPDAITVKGARGDTLVLDGSGLHDDVNDHRKTRIRITLQRLRGPIEGFDVPAGRELIGVVLRFENAGRLRYDDAQPQGQLTVRGGESGKQTSLIPIGGRNPCDDPSLKLTTGQSRTACLAFEIPRAGKPMAFEYVADDGYGDTGLWSLH